MQKTGRFVARITPGLSRPSPRPFSTSKKPASGNHNDAMSRHEDLSSSTTQDAAAGWRPSPCPGPVPQRRDAKKRFSDCPPGCGCVVPAGLPPPRAPDKYGPFALALLPPASLVDLERVPVRLLDEAIDLLRPKGPSLRSTGLGVKKPFEEGHGPTFFSAVHGPPIPVSRLMVQGDWPPRLTGFSCPAGLRIRRSGRASMTSRPAVRHGGARIDARVESGPFFSLSLGGERPRSALYSGAARALDSTCHGRFRPTAPLEKTDRPIPDRSPDWH